MKEKLIICPHCHGSGQTDEDARRYRVGLNWWIGRACTCCYGDGKTIHSQSLNGKRRRTYPMTPRQLY